MSGHIPCTCKGTWKNKRKNWYVITRNGNYSYFEHPKGCFHESDYSLVACSECLGMFSSKANYVSSLPDKAYHRNKHKRSRKQL